MTVQYTAQDDSPVPFRYSVSTKPKLNVFFPKELPRETDLLNGVRATQIGALLIGKLHEMPKSINYSVAWEVSFGFARIRHASIATSHAVITVEPFFGFRQVDCAVGHPISARKPKYWLTCKLSLPGYGAVKLA